MMPSMWENLTIGVCTGVIHENGSFNTLGDSRSDGWSVITCTVCDGSVLRFFWTNVVIGGRVGSLTGWNKVDLVNVWCKKRAVGTIASESSSCCCWYGNTNVFGF